MSWKALWRGTQGVALYLLAVGFVAACLLALAGGRVGL
jgi:hypothetical protein